MSLSEALASYVEAKGLDTQRKIIAARGEIEKELPKTLCMSSEQWLMW